MARYSPANVLGEFRLWLCNWVINKIPSHTVRLFYYKSIMGFKIGTGSSIHLNCRFNVKENFVLGNNSTINQSCHLDNRAGIIIGDNVSISPNVSLVTADHDLQSAGFEARLGSIVLDNFVFIGYGALILKNVRMFEGAVLSARGVLTKDVPAYEIYAGIPAKFVATREKSLKYLASYRRLFS